MALAGDAGPLRRLGQGRAGARSAAGGCRWGTGCEAKGRARPVPACAGRQRIDDEVAAVDPTERGDLWGYIMGPKGEMVNGKRLPSTVRAGHCLATHWCRTTGAHRGPSA